MDDLKEAIQSAVKHLDFDCDCFCSKMEPGILQYTAVESRDTNTLHVKIGYTIMENVEANPRTIH